MSGGDNDDHELKGSDDELLRRAKELQEKAGTAGRSDHSSAATRLMRDTPWIQRMRRFFSRAGKLLGPIGSLVGWLLRLLLRWLRWVTRGPKIDGEPPPGFSLRWLVLKSGLSFVAVFMLHVLWSAIYFYSTYFEETVYVTGKQEIVTGELYQFGGCTSLPCSTMTDNGKFYLIESSLYFPVMLYPEENVFANIPQQDGACHVEGYGIYFRTLRWLYKSAQLYQHVVDVSCRPYTEDEKKQAVLDGEIVRDQPQR